MLKLFDLIMKQYQKNIANPLLYIEILNINQMS